jgi:hypothetical protein
MYLAHTRKNGGEGCRSVLGRLSRRRVIMGVSIHYWALPPASALFQRLERDRAFVTLMASLFPYGCGVFFFFNELEAGEREEILKLVIRNRQSRLGPEPEARRLIEEFREELERTRREYPGIEGRRSSLEKTSRLIEQRLKEALQLVRADAEKFAGHLMYGNGTLGKPDAGYIEGLLEKNDFETLSYEMENTVGVISAPLVQEGAQVLSELNGELLFADDQEWYELTSFRCWRQLYQDAAAAGDALLVKVA